MKEIVIISGKGGTGKTSITASFAALAKDAVLADCDVDAADLHLVLNPTIKETHDFSGGKQAEINPELCTGCGQCEELCRFEAITAHPHPSGRGPEIYQVNPIACEGCGVCAHFCVAKAIKFDDVINGQWFKSETRFGPMVHAKMGIAEENSGKLVSLVKNEAKKIAEEKQAKYVIVDGSPGVGCPVIASLTGADFTVIVTEPTISGEHDFERVAQLAKHFNIPAAICVNKYDLNPEVGKRIIATAEKNGIMNLGSISYDKAVTAAQVARKSVVEHCDSGIAQEITKAWEKLCGSLK